MRGRRDGAERRPAQDELALAVAKEIGEVRVAAGKLLDGERSLGARQAALEIAVEGRLVESLVGADWCGVSDYWNSLRMRRATTIRCTSSGPS